MRCAPRVLENLKQGARLVNRGGKINNIKTKKHPTKSTKKNYKVPERKEKKQEIRAVCVLAHRLVTHSTLSVRLGR